MYFRVTLFFKYIYNGVFGDQIVRSCSFRRSVVAVSTCRWRLLAWRFVSCPAGRATPNVLMSNKGYGAAAHTVARLSESFFIKKRKSKKYKNKKKEERFVVRVFVCCVPV